MPNHWLMKSEPHVYPWSQLVVDGSTHWDGVRNYQARNMMRDEMKIGDMVLFYHSNCKPPHVAGIARVCKEGYPDFTLQRLNEIKEMDLEDDYYEEEDEELDIEITLGYRNLVFSELKSRNDKMSGKVSVRRTGFKRVVQHEIDHLDGILFPMRMKDLSLLSFNEELRDFMEFASGAASDEKDLGE